MENNKTISYLNSKVWYRLIKVVYCLFFATVFLIINTIAFQNFKPNIGDTLITCNRPSIDSFFDGTPKEARKGKIFTIREMAIFSLFKSSDFDNYNYKDFYSSPGNAIKVSAILDKCNRDKEDRTLFPNDIDYVNHIRDAQRHYDIAKEIPDTESGTTEQAEALQTEFDNQKQNDPTNTNLKYKFHLFDIKPIISHEVFIETFVVGNILTIFFFVFFQKVFYYIILGSFKPNK